MSAKKFTKGLVKRLKSVRGLISIARKAGFCIIGQDNLLGYDKKLYLLLLDKTAGEALKKCTNFLSKQKNASLLMVDNLPEVSGIENCKVLGIKNKALSEEIAKIIKGE